MAEDVMITKIHTIHPKNRVALARLRMLRHGVGALPVIDKNKNLVGMITLRDIDLAGNEAFALLIEDLMTPNLITGRKDSALGEIAEMMLRTGIQRIPIVNKVNQLVGLVTQTTIIRATAKYFDSE